MVNIYDEIAKNLSEEKEIEDKVQEDKLLDNKNKSEETVIKISKEVATIINVISRMLKLNYYEHFQFSSLVLSTDSSDMTFGTFKNKKIKLNEKKILDIINYIHIDFSEKTLPEGNLYVDYTPLELLDWDSVRYYLLYLDPILEALDFKYDIKKLQAIYLKRVEKFHLLKNVRTLNLSKYK